MRDRGVEVINADCLAALRDMPDASVDAIVTDPPYGLSNTTPDQVAETITRWVSGDREYLPTGRGFMGHEWDAFVPPVAVWDECLRVLKPGGHVLAFAGSRTHDLMTLGIRLAGFEIRDSVAWLYGSGFPKSMDVSKAIDRSRGENWARRLEFTEWMRSTGITAATIREATGLASMGGHYVDTTSQPAIPTPEVFDLLRPHLPEVPERIERLVAERTGEQWTDYARRPVTGSHAAGVTRDVSGPRGGGEGKERRDVPTSPEAAAWQGWGTALKPAFEPVTLARKPLTGTVAANVLEHGTGALNVDACRVGMSEADRARAAVPRGEWTNGGTTGATTKRTGETFAPAPGGRWPANVVLDESQAAELDRQSGTLANAGNKPGSMRTGRADGAAHERTSQVPTYSGGPSTVYNDKGGASRFFYTAKAPRSERPVVDGTAHPTVKPLALMRWLVRMVTPPGGTVLDPFAGSGTTLEAAMLEGMNPIGVERDPAYLPLIRHRIDRAAAELEARAEAEAGTLFTLDGDAT